MNWKLKLMQLIEFLENNGEDVIDNCFTSDEAIEIGSEYENYIANKDLLKKEHDMELEKTDEYLTYVDRI